MPPRRRKADASRVEADARAPLPPAPPAARRFRMVRFEDGSERAVRCESLKRRFNGRALSDFYGVPPRLSLRANMRSVDSVLGELLSGMNLKVAELAPELLEEAWLRAAGPVLGPQAELVSVVKGVATLRTLHPLVHREILTLRQVLVQALNRELGEGAVRSIRVRFG